MADGLVRILCPATGTVLACPASLSGGTIRCRACGGVHEVHDAACHLGQAGWLVCACGLVAEFPGRKPGEALTCPACRRIHLVTRLGIREVPTWPLPSPPEPEGAPLPPVETIPDPPKPSPGGKPAGPEASYQDRVRQAREELLPRVGRAYVPPREKRPKGRMAREAAEALRTPDEELGAGLLAAEAQEANLRRLAGRGFPGIPEAGAPAAAATPDVCAGCGEPVPEGTGVAGTDGLLYCREKCRKAAEGPGRGRWREKGSRERWGRQGGSGRRGR